MPTSHLRGLRATLSTVAACGALLCIPPVVSAADVNGLRAGAAKVDITPQDLTGLISVWSKPFEGVHDPIFARALVLANGSTTVAIVATDLVEFGPTMQLRQRIQRELSIPVDHVMIAASHDHNAPRAGPPTPGTSSADRRPYSTPAYVQFVDDQVIEAVRRAKAALQPARVGMGIGRTDVNVNRTGYAPKGSSIDPEGPSDKTVFVVKLENLSGEPIALLMNYAVHSIVAGPDNTLVTGDLAGAAERFVEQYYNNRAVALWTMGAAGDQNPKYNMSVPAQGMDKDPAVNKARAYDAMDAQGAVIGIEAIQASGRITRMTSTARIVAKESAFTCMTSPQRAAAKAGPPPLVPYPDTMDIRLGLIRINQIAIAGVSGEVFTNIYWHLKRESPLANPIMVTIANDRVGYIGDDAAYNGRIGNAAVVKGCAEDGIVNGLVSMMADRE